VTLLQQIVRISSSAGIKNKILIKSVFYKFLIAVMCYEENIEKLEVTLDTSNLECPSVRISSKYKYLLDSCVQLLCMI
jgi:hypothetical protein